MDGQRSSGGLNCSNDLESRSELNRTSVDYLKAICQLLIQPAHGAHRASLGARVDVARGRAPPEFPLAQAPKPIPRRRCGKPAGERSATSDAASPDCWRSRRRFQSRGRTHPIYPRSRGGPRQTRRGRAPIALQLDRIAGRSQRSAEENKKPTHGLTPYPHSSQHSHFVCR
jgi:hypothetical protein